MTSALRALRQLDLSGGENPVVSPYLVGEKQSMQCIGFILDEHGSLRVRDGTLLQNVAAPNTGQPIVKLFDFINVAGTVFQLAIQQQAAGNNQLMIRSANPWTVLKTLNSTDAIPDMATFTNLTVVTDGQASTPWKTDGTGAGTTQLTSSTGAVPQGGEHVAIHLGYCWLGNTFTSTGALDGPSSVRASDVNNLGSWPAANQVFVSKDDGQTIQGFGEFTIAATGISPTAVLMLFKDFSTYEVSGVFGSSSFSIQRAQTDMGCVAPRTIQFLPGFGIIRLTHKGFAQFDGITDTLISEEERPRIFGRDTFSGLNWATVKQSYAAQVANPPLYLCACPVSGSSLTRIFIYDLVRKAWTIATFANAISTLQLITDPGVLPVVLGGDFSGGFVRRYFAGDANDDGTPIPWTWVTRPAFASSPMDRKYILRLILKGFKFAAGSSVTCQFNYGPTAVTNSKTITFASAVSSFGGFSADAWGSSGFGASSGSQNTTDWDVNFYAGVIANTIYATITGTGQGRWRALEWHIREKALTRSTIGA